MEPFQLTARSKDQLARRACLAAVFKRLLVCRQSTNTGALLDEAAQVRGTLAASTSPNALVFVHKAFI
jgi:hypothetical protein